MQACGALPDTDDRKVYGSFLSEIDGYLKSVETQCGLPAGTYDPSKFAVTAANVTVPITINNTPTKLVAKLAVSLNMTVAEFIEDKKIKYRRSIASAAGGSVTLDDVIIDQIQNTRRPGPYLYFPPCCICVSLRSGIVLLHSSRH
jgi:hypothetical protein